jgi:hypothetical protein
MKRARERPACIMGEGIQMYPWRRWGFANEGAGLGVSGKRGCAFNNSCGELGPAGMFVIQVSCPVGTVAHMFLIMAAVIHIFLVGRRGGASERGFWVPVV